MREKTTPQLPSFKHLISLLNEKRAKDYTYATLFFIIFSIFITFAIRPSLTTALELSAQEKTLSSVDKKYELLIGQIVQIQSALEQVRDRLYVVDEALPTQPYLNIIMRDIQKSAIANNIVIKNINVQRINLVDTKKNDFRSMMVNVDLTASFGDYAKFERDMVRQRRLKNIKSVSIDRTAVGSESATLQIQAVIEGYYL